MEKVDNDSWLSQ